jgi:hypothetical protein
METAAAPPERTTGGRRCAFPPYECANGFAPTPKRAEDPRPRKITTMATTPQSAMALPRSQRRS